VWLGRVGGYGGVAARCKVPQRNLRILSSGGGGYYKLRLDHSGKESVVIFALERQGDGRAGKAASGPRLTLCNL
jgi:hypothetical protein